MKTSIHRQALLLLILSALLGGCAQQTGTISRAPAAYLVFLGEGIVATVTVDDRSFALTDDNARNHFEVSPGVHRVKVEKQGRIVVDREILLSDRQTVEIAIP